MFRLHKEADVEEINGQPTDHLVTRTELNGTLLELKTDIRESRRENRESFDRVYDQIAREADKRESDVKEIKEIFEAHCVEDSMDKISTARRWLYMIVGGIGGAGVSVGILILGIYIQKVWK